jgi:PIN domain nuclease of toxin-antitoxin system
MKTETYLLDTHVLLWMLLEPEKLSPSLQKKIDLDHESCSLSISSISLWEIAMLNFKKRINIYEPLRDFLNFIANIHGFIIHDISANIAAESIMLQDNFYGDPADRIIVSTSRVHEATLITRDQKIMEWSNFGHIRVLEA